MYYNDHIPPHFHARYGDYEALVQIAPLALVKGDLPPRALSLVIEWAKIHQKELLEDWNYAANNKKLQKIPPLD
jgi:hypothetical protein